jgi:signal transduction histidine kinase
MSGGVDLRTVPGMTDWRSLVSVRSLRYVAGVAVVAVGCWIAGEVGSALLLTDGVVAFWPTTGVAVAVLYLGGLRWWPGFVLGNLLANSFGAGTLPLAVRLPAAAGDLADAVLATVILLRLIGPHARIDRLWQVGAVLVAVGIGEAIGATVGLFAWWVSDLIVTSDMAVFWRGWWLGGLAGGLVVVPLALAWARPRAASWPWRRSAEAVLVLVAVAGLSVVALLADEPLTYAVFPALIWAALRLGPQGATLAVATATGIAVWMTANDLGPFVEQSPSDRVVNLQLYIIVAALTTMSLAAIVAERRQAAEEVSDSRARIAAAGERERRRLEGELHDGVQNRIVGLQVGLRLAQERTGDETLGDLIDEAGAVGDDLRRIAHGLSPPMLSTYGLAAALKAEVLHSAIPVDISANEIGLSEPHIERAAYLCCLESIQNAAKHGGEGTSATVRLRRAEGELQFSVVDNGCGFDRRTVTPGAGLANLHERVETVGGRVEILSAPGRGTTVAGAVPWPARSARENT